MYLYRPDAGGIAGSVASERLGLHPMIGNIGLRGRSFSHVLKAYELTEETLSSPPTMRIMTTLVDFEAE